ncbi:MAG: ABC transporter, partial [Dactylosporangium sp.]|nr:50S ribosome-binding GTPase [Dactylosporangium sp.]NNJ60176.1 ABC transporter [Dactylosporangium sp.]
MTGVIERLAGVRQFLATLDGHLPESHRSAASAVLDHAAERLALSGNHTVVALAGATGSGKSSVFNTLAGSAVSSVGVRRPTTSIPHACYWGAEGVDALLDWLAIPVNRRFDGECPLDAENATSLRGLVLLDLPDFDSVDEAHHAEVQRLLGLVDQVVWVLDPQKYADKTVHERYLRPFAKHHDITVVTLNQADTLTPDEAQRCLADLRQLLEADGLDGVPLFATSTVHSEGLAPLRAHLERCLAAGDVPLRRLDGEVSQVLARLAPLVAPDASERRLDRATVRPLLDALATTAGVPAIVEAVEPAHRHRAASSTGWPLARLFRRLSPDPRRRLRLPAMVAG